MRTLLTAIGTTLLLDTANPAQQSDYLVLAAVPAGDPFDAAARHLAEHHRARIVRFDPADLAPLRGELATAAPRHVALVMRPGQIDFAFQRRFLQLATEVDDDPFVDFAFGYLTGATGEEALALAQRGTAREPKGGELTHAMVAGGTDRSFVTHRPHGLRSAQLAAVQVYCAGEKAFAEEGRDRAFLAAELPQLAGRDAITFVGHGYPHEVHGGPDARDLAGLAFPGAVVLNVACYTGTTARWFAEDYQEGRLEQREVPPEQSFCLALLRTGVVGYTAYLCPRPAGPELDTDLAALVADGLSLGEVRRRDYDKTVLGFLGFGAERLALAPVADGERLAPGRDPVRDMMLEGATGGVLFGDPACVPFAGLPGEAPVAIEVGEEGEHLRLCASASRNVLFLHCSDPCAKWGDGMAMKVHARVPLGTRPVADVVVDALRLGGKPQPSRVLWAVEDDHGERFLQLKVDFPRPQAMPGDLSLSLRVVTGKNTAQGKARGGEVQRERQQSADITSREIQPFLLELASAREVSREALQAALDASAALLSPTTPDDEPLAKFAAFGSEGFRAVCVLLEAGHSHYRSWELLKAGWHPGDERHLIALAAGPDLPNYASWTVLHGLGVADTPAVRTLLADRLSTEDDPGLYMATAQGLALLGRRELAGPIGDRVLEFRPAWVGVLPHLVQALGELGGPAAIDRLERIAGDERCVQWQGVLAVLAKLDAAAAARVRERRAGGGR
jgi:hypothetical protein